MHRQKPLLPAMISRADYDELRRSADVWLQVMRAICQRHGLSAEKLVRFGDGTDAADGSSVVFAVGADRVIKLFPPYHKRLFEAESTVAACVFGKLAIPTPEIYADGMVDGWPYLVMSRMQGVPLASLWNTLGHKDQLSLVTELAGVVAQLHSLPVRGLQSVDGDWPGFVEARASGCVQRHREQGVSEYWLQQIPGFLARAAPLYPSTMTPAIVSGDIHEYHLFARQEQGQWRLAGL